MKNWFLLIVLGLSFSALSAATVNVSPGSSIQDAIDAAQDEDEIILEAGTYSGDLDLSGKNITIRGQGFDTIIQGTGTSSVIRCESGSSIIDQVSITGGSAVNGGGVYALGTCSIAVTNSAIYNNAASSTGAAICIRGEGIPIFSNNVVAFNTRSGSAEPHSIYINDASARFIRNTVTQNASPGNGFFIMGSNSRVRLVRNIISENGENGVGRGTCVLGGARLGSRVRMIRNIFYNNSASEIFINGRDFTGKKGVRRAQNRIGSSRFSRNRFVDPGFTSVGEDFNSSDFTSTLTKFGAFSE